MIEKVFLALSVLATLYFLAHMVVNVLMVQKLRRKRPWLKLVEIEWMPWPPFYAALLLWLATLVCHFLQA